MMEIKQEHLEGKWTTREKDPRAQLYPHDPKILFTFKANRITIAWTDTRDVEYTIEDNNGLTKLIKNANGNMLLEIWQIMDRDFSSLIVNYENKRYHIIKSKTKS